MFSVGLPIRSIYPEIQVLNLQQKVKRLILPTVGAKPMKITQHILNGRKKPPLRFVGAIMQPDKSTACFSPDLIAIAWFRLKCTRHRETGVLFLHTNTTSGK